MRRLPRLHLFGVALRTTLLANVSSRTRRGRRTGLLAMRSGSPAPHQNGANRSDNNGHHNGADGKWLLGVTFRAHGVVGNYLLWSESCTGFGRELVTRSSRRHLVIQAVSKCGV